MNLKNCSVDAEVDKRLIVATEPLTINCTNVVSESLKEGFSLKLSTLERRGAQAHKSCTKWITLIKSSATQYLSDWCSMQNRDINTIWVVAKTQPRLWKKLHMIQPSTISYPTNEDYHEADCIREQNSCEIQRATI